MGVCELRPSGDFDEQRFGNIVHEMAIASGLKPPQAMVMARQSGINAFATGWDEKDAVIAVTQGALQHLTREELQGAEVWFGNSLRGVIRGTMTSLPDTAGSDIDRSLAGGVAYVA